MEENKQETFATVGLTNHHWAEAAHIIAHLPINESEMPKLTTPSCNVTEILFDARLKCVKGWTQLLGLDALSEYSDHYRFKLCSNLANFRLHFGCLLIKH